jgi:hypothetical protein
MYILVYMDDIIIVNSSSSTTERFLHQLHREFAVKDLSNLSYFFGIEVHHTSNGLLLTQHKYITDLLLWMNMEASAGSPTPMLPVEKLRLNDGDHLSSQDTTRYHSVVGALQYLSFTHPDISFSVNRVCQFLSAPTTTHWTAVKHILRYLRATTTNYRLYFTKCGSTLLSAFSDTDWVGNLDDGRSTRGYTIFLATTRSARVRVSIRQCLDRVRRQSTKLLPTLRLNLYGFKSYFENLVYPCLDLRPYGVIILVPPTSR